MFQAKKSGIAVGILAVAGMASTIGHAAETLNASSNDRGAWPGSTIATSVVAVKCLSVTGASSNSISPRCFVSGPGYSSYVDIGQSIGTSGPGVVTLTCSGARAPGRTLSCSAVVDASACSDTELLSAYKSGGSTYSDTAPLFSTALATCTSATGAIRGSTPRCFVDGPGYYGTVNVGQTIPTTGPGTVRLSCSGSYSVNSTLSCSSRVEQICP